MHTYVDPHIVFAEIIQGRKLLILGGFDHGNYSREETIRGNTVVKYPREN